MKTKFFASWFLLFIALFFVSETVALPSLKSGGVEEGMASRLVEREEEGRVAVDRNTETVVSIPLENFRAIVDKKNPAMYLKVQEDGDVPSLEVFEVAGNDATRNQERNQILLGHLTRALAEKNSSLSLESLGILDLARSEQPMTVGMLGEILGKIDQKDESKAPFSEEQMGAYLESEIQNNIYYACLAKVAAFSLSKYQSSVSGFEKDDREAREWIAAERAATMDKEKSERAYAQAVRETADFKERPEYPLKKLAEQLAAAKVERAHVTLKAIAVRESAAQKALAEAELRVAQQDEVSAATAYAEAKEQMAARERQKQAWEKDPAVINIKAALAATEESWNALRVAVETFCENPEAKNAAAPLVAAAKKAAGDAEDACSLTNSTSPEMAAVISQASRTAGYLASIAQGINSVGSIKGATAAAKKAEAEASKAVGTLWEKEAQKVVILAKEGAEFVQTIQSAKEQAQALPKTPTKRNSSASQVLSRVYIINKYAADRRSHNQATKNWSAKAEELAAKKRALDQKAKKLEIQAAMLAEKRKELETAWKEATIEAKKGLSQKMEALSLQEKAYKKELELLAEQKVEHQAAEASLNQTKKELSEREANLKAQENSLAAEQEATAKKASEDRAALVVQEQNLRDQEGKLAVTQEVLNKQAAALQAQQVVLEAERKALETTQKSNLKATAQEKAALEQQLAALREKEKALTQEQKKIETQLGMLREENIALEKNKTGLAQQELDLQAREQTFALEKEAFAKEVAQQQAFLNAQKQAQEQALLEGEAAVTIREEALAQQKRELEEQQEKAKTLEAKRQEEERAAIAPTAEQEAARMVQEALEADKALQPLSLLEASKNAITEAIDEVLNGGKKREARMARNIRDLDAKLASKRTAFIAEETKTTQLAAEEAKHLQSLEKEREEAQREAERVAQLKQEKEIAGVTQESLHILKQAEITKDEAREAVMERDQERAVPEEAQRKLQKEVEIAQELLTRLTEEGKQACIKRDTAKQALEEATVQEDKTYKTVQQLNRKWSDFNGRRTQGDPRQRRTIQHSMSHLDSQRMRESQLLSEYRSVKNKNESTYQEAVLLVTAKDLEITTARSALEEAQAALYELIGKNGK